MPKVNPLTEIFQPVKLPKEERYHEFVEKKCHSDFGELTDQELAASS